MAKDTDRNLVVKSVIQDMGLGEAWLLTDYEVFNSGTPQGNLLPSLLS